MLAFEVTYNTCITLIKYSILCFYARVFPTPGVRIALYAIGAYVTGWFIANQIAVFLHCIPFKAIFNPTIKGAKCYNSFASLISLAVLNMVSDIAILILPTWKVWHLQMPRSHKFAVMGIFLLGGL